MKAQQTGADLVFEGFRLERRGLFRLDRAGRAEPVALGSRALDLLRLLAGRSGEVVAKDAIMAAVWPETEVEESNLTVQIAGLRRVLDQGCGQGSCIQTIPRRGYRFTGQVTLVDAGTPNAAGPPLPDKPSIAVLPFASLSGDPEQDYFADGMVEEIITALSRIRWLFVIARNSSFTYKGQAADVKRVGRELGVRYLLGGSVRKESGRVRIAAQLIDALSGMHLWADRFDGSLDNIFELQDQVAVSVAGVIEPTLQAAEIRRSSERPTSDLTAYDLYLRALPHVTTREKERLAYAFDLLMRAIDRDPYYGPALAQAAYYHYQLDLHGWAHDREQNRRNSIDFARRALGSFPDDPEVLAHAAHVFGYFDEDIDASIALVDRAIELNPSYASGWYWSGVLRNWVGRPDLALDYFATFLRLSPCERFPFYSTAIAIALFFERRFDEAVAKLQESLERFPNNGLTYRFLAACYAHMGRLDDARAIAEHMRELNLSVLETGARYRNPEHRELYLSGLRLAMGEPE